MEEPRGLCVLVGRGMRGCCYGRFYHVVCLYPRCYTSGLHCALACWLVIPSQYGASRCGCGVLTQHASPRGSEPGWVIFHIRDMILDMSLTGLYVSLSVFLVTIVLRKQGLCRHFVFHGMFHAMLVQRKHTRIEKCSHGIRWLHLMA